MSKVLPFLRKLALLAPLPLVGCTTPVVADGGGSSDVQMAWQDATMDATMGIDIPNPERCDGFNNIPDGGYGPLYVFTGLAGDSGVSEGGFNYDSLCVMTIAPHAYSLCNQPGFRCGIVGASGAYECTEGCPHIWARTSSGGPLQPPALA